ncbi:MAG TPA: choice-of-anchor P family protein [Nocardioides sp.]|nr:choice-of-anchor P family protein [Nocardioides sp.]
MSHRRALLRIPTLLSFVLAAAFALPATTAVAKPPPPPGGTTTTVATAYAGHAYGLSVAATALANLVKLGPVVVSDTGELPSTGGDVERALLTADVALSGVSLDADVVDAIVVGSGLTTDANAETVGLTGGVDGLLNISAGIIQAQATATCPTTSTTPVFAGHASLANVAVTLLGQPIAIAANPAPNTTIDLLNGVVRIVLNEQKMVGGRLVVNALHISVNGALSLLSTVASADIVVSHAEAGITCATSPNGGGPNCPVKDFMTGGGQLVSSTGAGVSFGFVGGMKNPGLMGHFNAVDHGTGKHIQGSTVTAYTATGPTSRQITYDNGALVANAADNGEPGTNDTLSFTGGYNGNPIAYGNIQLHHPDGCPALTTSGGGGKNH